MSRLFLFTWFVGNVLAFYPYTLDYSTREKASITSNFAVRDNTYDIINAPQPEQSDSAAVDQDGNDLSYMAVVRIGSQGAQYHMLLDSAGSQSWVFGSDCTSQACESHSTFGTANSDSLKESSTTFSVGYGTGTVNGVLATDNVTVAGLSVPLTFGIASNASSEFLSYPLDGILGLGQAPSSSPTFMNALSQQGLVPSTLFGIHLSRDVDGVNDNDGEIDFGTPNTNLYSGGLAYSPAIADQSFWQVAVDGAGVDGKSASVGSQRMAILDTGTSYVYLPPSDAQAIHSLISGSSQNGETFTVPCNTQSTVQISISNVNYNLSYQDLVGSTTDGGANCGSKIIGRQTFGPNQWLVGDTFLKNVYTVFDFDQNRVGLGVKAADSNGGKPTSSSTSSSGSASSTVSASSVSSSGSTATNSTVGSPSESSPVPGTQSGGSSSGTPAPPGSTQSIGGKLAGGLPILFVGLVLTGLGLTF